MNRFGNLRDVAAEFADERRVFGVTIPGLGFAAVVIAFTIINSATYLQGDTEDSENLLLTQIWDVPTS